MNSPVTSDPPYRTALVTGANRGIGLEIVRQLARKGLRVLLTSRRRPAGERARESLRAEGVETEFCLLDVCDPGSVDQAVQWVRETHGRLDVLVNNAAIAIDREERLAEVDPTILEETFRTNVYGPLELCQSCIPMMREQGYGRIVNVSSGRGSFHRLAAGGPCYRISKTVLNAMTVVLADELEGTNILVNAMTPGWVRTRLGGLKAPRSVSEGAKTAVWLSTLDDAGPTGKFFKDGEEFPW